MKKILIFSLVYYPKHIGGAEVAIKEITDRISSNDIEYHMVCLRFDETLPKVEKIGNVVVHRIGLTRHNPSMGDLKKFPLHVNKLIFQFTAFLKARELHKKNNYDAIWGMMAHSTAVPCGLFKLFYPKVPYVLTLQEGDPTEYIEKKMRPLWPLFVNGFRRPDLIQSISNFLAGWARHMGYKGRVEVIPNAVNTKHFSQIYTAEELDTVRSRCGVVEGNIYLITTSRLVHKNAIDDVIQALPLLDEHIHFLILGDGPDRRMLENLAEKEQVTNRVHFLGQIDHAEMPKYLRVSDIFIRPSRSEGMGNSFVEAMAAGLPVIATQEGGIADFLFDAEKNRDKEATGWAVEKDSPESITHAVERILSNPTETREVIERARKMAFEKYDWDLIAQEMKERVFDRVAE